MSRRSMAYAFAAGTILAALTLLIARRLAPPSSDLTVGAVLALTGPGSNYGKSLQRGLQLAQADINSAGILGKRKIRVVFEDSRAEATTGLAAFSKLVSLDKAPVVFGSISSVVLAIAPVANERHVVFINSSAISPRVCEGAVDYVFSFMVSGRSEAVFIADHLADSGQPIPTAVIYSNNASGKDTFAVVRERYAATGGRLLAAESYELGTGDFSTQITRLRASGAQQVILIAFSSDEFAGILRTAKALGYSPKWVSYSGFETHETLSLAGDAANGVTYSFPKYDPSPSGLAARFYKRYSDRFTTWPDVYTTTSYDTLWALAQAVGDRRWDAPTIRDALRSAAGTEGLFGRLKYGDRQCVERQLMWKQVENGAYVTR